MLIDQQQFSAITCFNIYRVSPSYRQAHNSVNGSYGTFGMAKLHLHT